MNRSKRGGLIKSPTSSKKVVAVTKNSSIVQFLCLFFFNLSAIKMLTPHFFYLPILHDLQLFPWFNSLKNCYFESRNFSFDWCVSAQEDLRLTANCHLQQWN